MDFKTISLPGSLKEHILTKDIMFFREIKSLELFADIPQLEILTILVVKKGKLSINVGGNTITARKHDLLVLPISFLRQGGNTSDTFECSIISLSKDFMFSILSNTRIKWSNIENLKSFNPLVHLEDNIMQIMSCYFNLLNQRTFLEKGHKYETTTSTLVISMIADLFNYIKLSGINDLIETDEPVRQSDVIFKRFIALINETLADNNLPSRSIQYYAENLNVSPKYLTHVCKTCSGETAKSIIGHMLEKRIMHLLMHSDLSIKEIAVNLGFPDVSNFGRYVKAKFGKSPRAIRASLKN